MSTREARRLMKRDRARAHRPVSRMLAEVSLPYPRPLRARPLARSAPPCEPRPGCSRVSRDRDVSPRAASCPAPRVAYRDPARFSQRTVMRLLAAGRPPAARRAPVLPASGVLPHSRPLSARPSSLLAPRVRCSNLPGPAAPVRLHSRPHSRLHSRPLAARRAALLSAPAAPRPAPGRLPRAAAPSSCPLPRPAAPPLPSACAPLLSAPPIHFFKGVRHPGNFSRRAGERARVRPRGRAQRAVRDRRCTVRQEPHAVSEVVISSKNGNEEET
jgi:hypothetical protein